MLEFLFLYGMMVLSAGGNLQHIPLEQPIVDLEKRIALLRQMAGTQGLDLDRDISELEQKVQDLRVQIFTNLTAYETTQLSRHPQRPNSLDIIKLICSSFTELHGDRKFYDDPAIVGGIAQLDKQPLMIIGHQKGRGTNDNLARNFGMPKPEGYRKALRFMQVAEKFNLPIVTLIDTPGAYPGVGAEERGQSEAIGHNITVMSRLRVPIITIVIGEGGSGGALAIGVADRVYMLRHAIYSVISPEGCASILFKDSALAPLAAEALQLTADRALSLQLVDGIIPEPLGGGHHASTEVADNIKSTLLTDLKELRKVSATKIVAQRQQRLSTITFFTED